MTFEPPARSLRKPKGEGHSRRAEILAAAERIFVEHGYDGATIRKIAEDVGLSSTALYMHFPDKSAILQEICSNAFDVLIKGQRAIQEDRAPADQRLRRMMEGYVRFAFENPNAYRLVYMTRPMEARDGAETAALALGAELYRSFLSVVAELAEQGRLLNDAAATAQAIWASGHGLVSLMITKPYFEWADRDALVDTLFGGLLDGLLKDA